MKKTKTQTQNEILCENQVLLFSQTCGSVSPEFQQEKEWLLRLLKKGQGGQGAQELLISQSRKL